MPSKEFLLDALRETKMEEDALSECVDTFILNVKFLGLLRTLSGTERLITFEHALDETTNGLAVGLSGAKASTSQAPVGKTAAPSIRLDAPPGFDDVCFYISPIGADASEQRRHADFLMEYVIEPALKEFGLRLVRADQIGKAGMIGKQVLEHVLRSKLVIADLPFIIQMFFMSFAFATQHDCLRFSLFALMNEYPLISTNIERSRSTPLTSMVFCRSYKPIRLKSQIKYAVR